MASEEKQSEEDAENPRIECKTKRSVNSILETLKEQYLKHNDIDALSDVTDPESLNRKIFQVILLIPHPFFAIENIVVTSWLLLKGSKGKVCCIDEAD